MPRQKINSSHHVATLRQLLNCSQEDLAYFLGCSQSTLAHVERGSREMPAKYFHTFKKLRNAVYAAARKDPPKQGALEKKILQKSKLELHQRRFKNFELIQKKKKDIQIDPMLAAYFNPMTRAVYDHIEVEFEGATQQRYVQFMKIIQRHLLRSEVRHSAPRQWKARIALAARTAELREIEKILEEQGETFTKIPL